MTFGEALRFVALFGCFAVSGMLLGALCKGFLRRFCVIVLGVVHTILFLGFLCACSECGMLEMLMELLDAEFWEGILVCGMPTVHILGVSYGQRFRIRIERR